jgi:hypothetical protein
MSHLEGASARAEHRFESQQAIDAPPRDARNPGGKTRFGNVAATPVTGSRYAPRYAPAVQTAAIGAAATRHAD